MLMLDPGASIETHVKGTQKHRDLCLKNIWITALYLPGGSDGKESICKSRRPGFDPWVGKILCRRKWQPTPVFLPRKSHGRRSLAGYSPWGRRELNMTEQLTHT